MPLFINPSPFFLSHSSFPVSHIPFSSKPRPFPSKPRPTVKISQAYLVTLKKRLFLSNFFFTLELGALSFMNLLRCLFGSRGIFYFFDVEFPVLAIYIWEFSPTMEGGAVGFAGGYYVHLSRASGDWLVSSSGHWTWLQVFFAVMAVAVSSY